MSISPDFLSNVVSNLLGTIIGALLAYFFAVKQFKIQKETELRQRQIGTALAFYEELTGNEFSFSRLEASKIFKEHITANSIDDFYEGLPEEEKKNVRAVITYFRRLQLAVEYKQIDEQMVIDLLAGEFLHWYFRWLDNLVPETWSTRQNIDKLNNWLESVMPKAKYEQSKKKHLKQREKLLLDAHSGNESND